MLTSSRDGDGPRNMAALLMFVLATLCCTGDAFRIYDIIGNERIKRDSLSDGVYLTLEQCTLDRCHGSDLSKITRAVCVLQCFVKTSSSPDRPDPGAEVSPDRRDAAAAEDDDDDDNEPRNSRELDPVQACIEAKCLDSPHYMRCAYDLCLTGRRRIRQSADVWSADTRRSLLDRIRAALPARSKRPIELCSGCFPNSSSWPRCRASCGK